MGKKPERIVLDTNLFISFLISHSNAQFDELLKSGRIRLLFSDELLTEFLETTQRPRFRQYFNEKDLFDLLNSLHHYADLIPVFTTVNVCRDRNDNFILALCKDGTADFLLTGDSDLLSLGAFGNTTIMKLSEFLNRTKHMDI